jgi:hypothetical protein
MAVIDRTHNKIYVVIHFIAELKDTKIQELRTVFNKYINTLSTRFRGYNIIILGDCNGVFHESEEKMTDGFHDNIYIKYYGSFTGHGAFGNYGNNGIDIIGSYMTNIFTNNLQKLAYPEFDQASIDILNGICRNYIKLLEIFGMEKVGEQFSDHIRLSINTDDDNTYCIISSTLSYLLAFQTFKHRVTLDNIKDILTYFETL